MEKEKRNAERARENRYQILECIGSAEDDEFMGQTINNVNLSNKEVKKINKQKGMRNRRPPIKLTIALNLGENPR